MEEVTKQLERIADALEALQGQFTGDVSGDKPADSLGVLAYIAGEIYKNALEDAKQKLNKK